MSTSDLKSLIEAKKAVMQKRALHSPLEFQADGYFLAENLGDLAHRSIYIKLAKDQPRQLLDNAYHWAKESAPNLKGKNALAKMFMWKVKQLRMEAKTTAISTSK